MTLNEEALSPTMNSTANTEESQASHPAQMQATRQFATDLPVLSETVSHTEGGNTENKGDAATTPPNPDDKHLYPEGGKDAWLVVFGSFTAMIASFGIMNTIGTFQTYLASHQLSSYSEGQIGWIFGVYAFISFFGGIQIGPIFDAAGPRGLIAAGTICLVTGLMILSVSKLYWHFMVTFGILTGLGTSLIFTPAVASIGHWFLVKRGYAIGLATTGGSIGGIVFPLIIQAATPKVGFAWAVRIVEFIDASPGSQTPSDSSIISSDIDEAATEKKHWASFLKFGSKNGKNKKSTKSQRKGVKIDLSAFRDPRFTLTTIGIFLIEWGIFVPLSYLTSYSLRYLGLPENFSYQLLAILNTGSVFGRWLPGIVADRIGRFNTMILTVSFCLVVVLALWLPSSAVAEDNIGGRKAIMIVFALLYGFGSGSGISLTPVCVGQICDTREYGTKYGTCYFFVSFGTLTGIPIAGQIINSTNGKFTGLILFTAASYVGALLFFIAARIVGGGKSWRTVY
ncbi:uncharacterized protein LAJ45_04244 [Morchella importuna]|uniref:uncharacterized protein n=1 Tax=Morchella importuna TaxID=1174673 RepID=UPI001E8D2990|nr:uncharacterized protein LAJ45_04244 [Morchella importuna]KAH8151622.1 hypothetical protein LAJ45_04244 [Morchella importuna]